MRQLVLLISLLIITSLQAANPSLIWGSGGYALNLAPSGIELDSGCKLTDGPIIVLDCELELDTLTVNDTFELNGAAITDILDEDTLVSNRADAVPTQQSAKAYVDAAIATVTDLVSALDTIVDGVILDVSDVIGDLADHIADATDAHDASAISNVAAGNLSATDQQSANNEMQTDIDTRATSAALTSHEADSTSIHGIADTSLVWNTTNAVSGSNKTLTSAVLNTGVSGTAIDIDGTLAANSDTLLASQKAVRSHVAAAVLGAGVVVTKSSNATLATTGENVVLGDTTSGNVTLTLPAASGNSGLSYIIKKTVAANQLIIDPNSSETVEGAATFTMYNQYNMVQIVCDGSNWHILSSRIQNKLHQRALATSDDTSDGTLTQLAISGLTIGKRYFLILQADITTDAGTATIEATHDGTVILRARHGSASSTVHEKVSGHSTTFVATATSISFANSGMTSGDIVHGNNTSAETWVEVHEWNNSSN